MLLQQWSSAGDLEAHMATPHAQQFSKNMVTQHVLKTEPSISILGQPLNHGDLAKLGAEAAAAEAEAAALSAEAATKQKGQDEASQSRPPSQISSGSAQDLSSSLNRSTGSLRNSRSSSLQQSASLIMKR